MGQLISKSDESMKEHAPWVDKAAQYVPAGLITYETVQVSKVRSPTLAIIHNSVRIAILAYVIVVVFVQQRGYQVEEDGVGSVQVEVRGVGFTHWGKDDSDDLNVLKAHGVPLSHRVSDTGDLVFPPKEEGALFLTTNYLDNPSQMRSVCPSGHKQDKCQSDDDCPRLKASKSLLGYYNGTCDTADTETCMIIAWCPSAADATETSDENVLPEVETFLLKTRATIKFPFHGVVT